MALTGVVVLSTLAVVIGAALGWVNRPRQDARERLIGAIDALLPQTQCAQCGYPGCRPYAAAIADGAAINRCPPGGGDTIQRLADLLGRPAEPLAEGLTAPTPGGIARIDENACIGCALCLPACPVDAILGAPRHMHTVLTRHCTGCELCLAPCPVDCIEMVRVDAAAAWRWLSR
jgi:electron transport complex protein RnfB